MSSQQALSSRVASSRPQSLPTSLHTTALVPMQWENRRQQNTHDQRATSSDCRSIWTRSPRSTFPVRVSSAVPPPAGPSPLVALQCRPRLGLRRLEPGLAGARRSCGGSRRDSSPSPTQCKRRPLCTRGGCSTRMVRTGSRRRRLQPRWGTRAPERTCGARTRSYARPSATLHASWTHYSLRATRARRGRRMSATS